MSKIMVQKSYSVYLYAYKSNIPKNHSREIINDMFLTISV